MSNARIRFVVGLLVLVAITLVAGVAHAADLHNATQSYQGLLDLIQSDANSRNVQIN